ncbi:MAG TPA: hypothetical protein VEP93_09500 [Variovorax sp.]|nr:hypothetical protein [Variovorax sp.]
MQLLPLLAACVLAAVYGLGRSVREGGPLAAVWGPRRRISAAAGVSIAYVFVDVLPELAVQNESLRRAAEGAALFAEQRIYLLSLLSFVVMYGIDHIVLSRRAQRHAHVERGESDPAYWLHIAGYAAYSALIGYLLVERAARGYAALAVYVLAMAVHFVVVNHSLAEEHGKVYRRQGHWILAASVLAGCAFGMAGPLSEATFARMFALLAGGVVMTSLRSELPDDRNGRFWPFCSAAVVFAIVLVLA